MAQKTIVGLDIGTTKLRAVEAVMVNGSPKIIGVASTSLPEGAVVGGELQKVEAFAEAVKNLWKIGKFTAKDARVVINSERNIAKLATMDDEIDFGKTLPFRLKTKHDLKTSEYYISYHTLRKYETEEEDRSLAEGHKTVPKRDIFLAAAQRSLVDAVLNGFAKTDIRLLSIDLAPLALIRGESDLSEDSDNDKMDVHVNIGGDTTIIVIANHAQPVFVRIIDIGGNRITESIADQLEVSLEEAERLKLKTLSMNPKILQRPLTAGTVFGDDSETPEDDGEKEYSFNELDAYEIVNDELGAIIFNISTTVLYFIDQNQFGLGGDINHVYVSGGTAAFGKIRHHLIHELGADNTSMSKPLTRMTEKGLLDADLAGQFAKTQHEYTMAVGAVIGQGGEKND